MKSQLAVAELRRMIKDGLLPTPEDCIRLNAFGLRIDEAQGRRADDAAAMLPRVAWLSGGVWFRQPTVGHEIWIRSVMRFIDPKDYESILAVNCYALSMPYEDLPDPSDPSNVQRSASDFARRMRPYTRDVLYAAVSYARFGIDPKADEKAPASAEDQEPDDDFPTPESCVAVASMVSGVAYLWGLSLEDVKAMTYDQLDSAVRTAIVAHGLAIGESGEQRALGEFYAVRDEIRGRLEHERSLKEVS